MNKWTSLVAASLLAVTFLTPAWALTVKIETAMPLADHSDETLNLAIRRAIESTVEKATAMGLSWIWLDGARVLSDSIVVRMVATDDDNDDDDDDEGPATDLPRTF